MSTALNQRLIILFAVFLTTGLSISAQSSSLRIADVRFSEEVPQFGGERWLAMEVLVDVRGNSDRTAPNPEFIDSVKIQVAIAHNLGDQSRPRLEYFWTQVEAPTLERGAHRFRFYLSPEQVRRGRMDGGEPYAWFVQADIGNESEQTATPNQSILAVSRDLREMARLERFKELLEEQKEKRAGILLPQIETPFRDMYLEDTPFVRGYDRGE